MLIYVCINVGAFHPEFIPTFIISSSVHMFIHFCLLHSLSALETYYVPKDGSLASYRLYINMLPNYDHPEAFGQHPNADIACQIIETNNMFGTLLSLQPQESKQEGGSKDDKVKAQEFL